MVEVATYVYQLHVVPLSGPKEEMVWYLAAVSKKGEVGEGGRGSYPWSVEMDAGVQRLNFVTTCSGPVFAGADFYLRSAVSAWTCEVDEFVGKVCTYAADGSFRLCREGSNESGKAGEGRDGDERLHLELDCWRER
jgi:hypothetical protein